MNTRAVISLALLSLLLSSITAVAETTRCTAITKLPVTITKQGSYCLFKNLGYTAKLGAAIFVEASNVIIDLNGHTLSGLAAGRDTDATGIRADNRQNITIKNGSIRGFGWGIILHDSSLSPMNVSQRHLIEHIRASRNTIEAMRLVGSKIIVRNNQVIDTGGSPFSNTGISISGRNARVLNNDISQTKATGPNAATALHVTFGDGSVIENTRIDSVSTGTLSAFGIRVSSSTDVMINSNRISSVETGISYSGSSTGKYMNNLTSNVTTPFSGGTPVGIND